jgi:DNA ligase-1
MLFADVAATSAAVAATAGRKAKIALLASALMSLGATGDPQEIEAGAAYLAGEMRQRQIGVGWASLRDLPAPAEVATLSVAEIDRRFAELGSVSGSGRRRGGALVQSRLPLATADEQRLLGGIISGEVRQGAQAGLLADAIAAAAGVPAPDVRRALLLSGDLKTVAVAALLEGQPGLAAFQLRIGRPLAPMLAQAAGTIEEALAATGSPAAVDAKLDGIRIQVHRDGDDVRVFSRSLDDLTARLPEVVAAAISLGSPRLVLDGEALFVGPDGRPRPFQETAGRAAKLTPGSLTPFFFDAAPTARTWSTRRAPYVGGARRGCASRDARKEAHGGRRGAGPGSLRGGARSWPGGVVIKAAEAAYDVGRRGSAWVKVKPRHTLDLVILAAEWGHGRRKGWLSNLHLGARDPAGGFVMLGKTFKGLTDAMLAWQTERLLGLAIDKGDWLVTVRPELVVEIAFDGIQASTRYPGGVTLRFARVLRYREDKSAAEADTLAAVRALSHAAHRTE